MLKLRREGLAWERRAYQINQGETAYEAHKSF